MGAQGTTTPDGRRTAPSTQNVLLLATDLGLGATPVGAFDDTAVATAVATALGLPDGYVPMLLVPVGHPDPAP